MGHSIHISQYASGSTPLWTPPELFCLLHTLNLLSFLWLPSQMMSGGSHCSLDLHFAYDLDSEHFYYTCWPTVYLYWKALIQVSCSFVTRQFGTLLLNCHFKYILDINITIRYFEMIFSCSIDCLSILLLISIFCEETVQFGVIPPAHQRLVLSNPNPTTKTNAVLGFP